MMKTTCFHCEKLKGNVSLLPIYRKRQSPSIAGNYAQDKVKFAEVVQYWIYEKSSKPVDSSRKRNWLGHGNFSFPLDCFLDIKKPTRELQAELNLLTHIQDTHKQTELTNFVNQFENEFCCNHFVECAEGTIDVDISFNDFFVHEKLRSKNDLIRLKSLIPFMTNEFQNTLHLKCFQTFFGVYVNSFLRIKFLLESNFTWYFSRTISSAYFLSMKKKDKEVEIQKMFYILNRTASEMENFEQHGLLKILEKVKLNSDITLTPSTSAANILKILFDQGRVPFYMTNVCTYFFAFPLNAWQKLKTDLTVLCYKALNTGVMLSVLNSYEDVLNIMISNKVPATLKKHSLAILKGQEKIPKRFNASSETLQYIYGTRNVLPNWFKENCKEQSRSLNIDATSVILKPLIRADLHFSKPNLVFEKSRQNQGYIGRLLVTLIYLGRSDVVLQLLRNEYHFIIQYGLKIRSCSAEKLLWYECDSFDLNLLALPKQVSFAEKVLPYLLEHPEDLNLTKVFLLFFSSIKLTNDKIRVLSRFLPWFSSSIFECAAAFTKRNSLSSFLRKLLSGRNIGKAIGKFTVKDRKKLTIFNHVLKVVTKQVKLKIIYVLLQETAKLQLWQLFSKLLSSCTKCDHKALNIIKHTLVTEFKLAKAFNKKNLLVPLQDLYITFCSKRVNMCSFIDVAFIESIRLILITETYLTYRESAAVLFFLSSKRADLVFDSNNSLLINTSIGLLTHNLLTRLTNIENICLTKDNVTAIFVALINNDHCVWGIRNFISAYEKLMGQEAAISALQEAILYSLYTLQLSFLYGVNNICLILELFFDKFNCNFIPADNTFEFMSSSKAIALENYEKCLTQVKLVLLDLSVNGFGYLFDSQLIRLFEYFTNYLLLYLSKEDIALLLSNFLDHIIRADEDYWYQGLIQLISKLKADDYFNKDDAIVTLCKKLKPRLKKNSVFKLTKSGNVFRISFLMLKNKPKYQTVETIPRISSSNMQHTVSYNQK